MTRITQVEDIEDMDSTPGRRLVLTGYGASRPDYLLEISSASILPANGVRNRLPKIVFSRQLRSSNPYRQLQ